MMSKKQTAARKKTGARAAAVTRKTATKKKKAVSNVRKKVVKTKAATRPAAKSKSNAADGAAKKRVRKLKLPKSMGRPTLPGDARLDLVFQKDYQAREVFAFLGVQTIRELEQFAAADIIERLTSPMVQTVERIRKSLALNNRCLAKDRDFALKFQTQWKFGRK